MAQRGSAFPTGYLGSRALPEDEHRRSTPKVRGSKGTRRTFQRPSIRAKRCPRTCAQQRTLVRLLHLIGGEHEVCRWIDGDVGKVHRLPKHTHPRTRTPTTAPLRSRPPSPRTTRLPLLLPAGTAGEARRLRPAHSEGRRGHRRGGGERGGFRESRNIRESPLSIP